MASQPLVPPQTGLAKGTVTAPPVLPIDQPSADSSSQSSLPEGVKGVELYDVSGKEPVLGSMHPDDVTDAVASGKYSFAKGTQVDVISPAGVVGQIPAEDAPNAFAQGYRFGTHEAVTEAKYGGTGQTLAAAAEAAGRAATFGLSTGVERALGVPAEDIRGREEANPIASGVGSVAGLIGSAFIPGLGEANLLSKAGGAASKAVGLAAKPGFINAVGDAAVRGAFENALFQGGEEVSKMFAEDPTATAEHAAARLGLSAVLGGVFGGALGAAAKGVSKALGVEPKVMVSQADMPAFEAGELSAVVKASEEIPKTLKDKVLSALDLGKKKSNASEIQKAAATLGAPETPGMLLEHPSIAPTVDALANSPYTMSGAKVRGQLDQAYQTVQTAVQEASASSNKMSQAELGSALQQSLTDNIKTAYAPQKEVFEQLAAMHSMVPVEKPLIGELKTTLNSIEGVKLGGDSSRLVRSVLKMAENVKTAEDINLLRNQPELKAVGNDAYGWLKAKIRDALVDVQEKAIESASKSFPAAAEGGENVMASLIAQGKKARADYAPYIQKVQELSEWLGKGKIRGTEDVLTFMNERLSPTDLSKKLFGASKDPAFTKFFSKAFPEQYAMVREYQRAGIVSDSMAPNGKLSLAKFFKKFNDMEPEAQKALYSPEQIEKIKAAQLYSREAIPKNYNPSGTSHMESSREAFHIPKSMIYANARDAAMRKFIDMAGNVDARNAMSLGEATVNSFKSLDKSIRAVVNAGKEFPHTVVPTVAMRKKLDALVSASIQNPERMIDSGANNPIPAYSSAFGSVSARAVAYLNSLKPVSEQNAPLDKKSMPDKSALAKYNRALDLAQNPLIITSSIKNGSITPQDVVTLKTIYPSFYNSMATKLSEQMIDAAAKGINLSYPTRMGISMFLGEPMDSTMKPESIIRAQPKPQQSPGSAPPSQGGIKHGTSALSKMPGIYQTPGQASQSRQLKN